VYLIYQQLRAKGYVEVGDIEWESKKMLQTMVLELRLSVGSGLLIADIIPDGPAEAAGLQVQDTILSFDGSSVTSSSAILPCASTLSTQEAGLSSSRYEGRAVLPRVGSFMARHHHVPHLSQRTLPVVVSKPLQ
jgi:hypothetical protein